jgi:urease beta subunit
VRVEIVTLRPVWIKAVADDVRRFERLVAENQRIAVGARTFVLLRIGDAGAVRLIVNGVDRGVQGRDGQVVTRRFEAGSDSSVPR